MTTLTERAVLVTGANRGMGREYVTQLLARGVATVYAGARNPDTVDAADPRVIPLRLDVTDTASVTAAAEAATDVSVLINNAGIVRGASVLSAETGPLRAECTDRPTIGTTPPRPDTPRRRHPVSTDHRLPADAAIGVSAVTAEQHSRARAARTTLRRRRVRRR